MKTPVNSKWIQSTIQSLQEIYLKRIHPPSPKSRIGEISLDKWIGVVALMAKVGALAIAWAWLLAITSSIHFFVSVDCPRIHMKAHAFPLELTLSCMWRVDIGWVMNPREYGRRLAYVEATSPST